MDAAPLQYVTHAAGEKTGVGLHLAEYEELLEDLHDLAVLAERRNESTVSLNKLAAGLTRDGLLPG